MSDRVAACSIELFLKTKPSNAVYNHTFNRGNAFTHEEREKLAVRGLLPPALLDLDTQVKRSLAQMRTRNTPIKKYLYLSNLKLRNETLFYKLLIDHITEIMPLVYTPTVGAGCQQFSTNYMGPEGMFFSKNDKGHMRKMLDNWPQPEVDIIVVTDGSRILGLGDLGANGMGIPIGKLSLYVAAAGFHPARTLPVTIDCGTNTQKYLDDPNYIGLHHKRLDHDEFYSLLDEFMKAVSDKWPGILVQFEDFSNDHCFELLEKHRNNYLCFNDDIQGTGAVITAGFLNAVKMSGIPIQDHRLVFFGAGSAGIGVADQIVQAIVGDHPEISEEEARKKFWFIDSRGMITTNRGDKLAVHKLPYARDDNGDTQVKGILNVIKYVKPTGLIGLAGTRGGMFDEAIIREMAALNEKPIIFALSNPTSKSECSAEDAYKFTDGRCIFASGSPFDDVTLGDKVFKPSQGNNMYVFPGLGFGSVLAKSKAVTDSMIITAARALAASLNDEEYKEGRLYPRLERIRELSAEIATAVIEKAFEEKVAQIERPKDILAYVKEHMYFPDYATLDKSCKL